MMMTTVETQQIVNFTVSDVNYGVPVDQVREVRDLQVVVPVPGAPSYVKGISNLRGQLITIIDLQKRLALRASNIDNRKIIVIELENHSVGVIVDTVTDVSIITGEEIQGDMDFTTKYNAHVIGVGKQNDDLVVILDLANVAGDVDYTVDVADASDQMQTQMQTAST